MEIFHPKIVGNIKKNSVGNDKKIAKGFFGPSTPPSTIPPPVSTVNNNTRVVLLPNGLDGRTLTMSVIYNPLNLPTSIYWMLVFYDSNGTFAANILFNATAITPGSQIIGILRKRNTGVIPTATISGNINNYPKISADKFTINEISFKSSPTPEIHIDNINVYPSTVGDIGVNPFPVSMNNIRKVEILALDDTIIPSLSVTA